jgi:hypothetical protein
VISGNAYVRQRAQPIDTGPRVWSEPDDVAQAPYGVDFTSLGDDRLEQRAIGVSVRDDHDAPEPPTVLLGSTGYP